MVIRRNNDGPSLSTNLDDFGDDGEAIPSVPWNVNTKPVVLGKLTAATADRLSVNPQGAPTQPYIRTMYDLTRGDASGWLTQLRATDRTSYSNLMDMLRATEYLGPRAKSPASELDAFKKAANEASARYLTGETENVDVIEYIYSQLGQGGAGGDGTGGGRGGYKGPVASRTMQAESDIKATANALAIELIGRPVDDKELDRIVKRMRGAEMAQPQVTTSVPGSSVTKQGLTPQGREDILREVISKNPEFIDYQLDTTVMDLMLEDIDTGKQVARG